MINFKTVAEGIIFGAAYEVNKSKFFAHIMHVDSEEMARDFLQTIRKKNFDAITTRKNNVTGSEVRA